MPPSSNPIPSTIAGNAFDYASLSRSDFIRLVGLLKLQRKIAADIKSCSVGHQVAGIAGEVLNCVRADNTETAEGVINHAQAIIVDIPV